ncbi:MULTISPECIES: EAL domain-containing protein [Pseudomonas]|nr:MULTISPECIES: EAL domain-containing protein [Pseudomonas]MCW2291208.1 diguanylate cyclase (GGDEF)-like protein/PAS domain S-box-containing protein [Pseudomonas sp. BIGb0408]NYH74221.1 diguanylate cyclase (GGDEF)-like protein/PAS domain S-box-containing protein [Pseudomonas flavescens]
MSYRVLLVAEVELFKGLQAALSESRDDSFDCVGVASLSAADTRLKQRGIDAVLLDVSLLGGASRALCSRMFASAADVPVLLLGEPDNTGLARQAQRWGARGYVLKGQTGSGLLARTVSAAIHRQLAEMHRLSARSRAEITLDCLGDAVIGTDVCGQVDYLNRAAERLTGYQRTEALGRPIAEVMTLLDGVTRTACHNPVERLLRRSQRTPTAGSTLLMHSDGSTLAIEQSATSIRDGKGPISGTVTVFRDVSAAHAIAARMSHLAQHDDLTQLPNRALLNDRIHQAISLSRRTGNAVAVMFLDLDHFKSINDSLGHHLGDKLLQAVAQRLSACVRGSDTVSRNGGDEFVVLLAGDSNESSAGLTARKIRDALQIPYFLEEQRLQITCSIGISLYPSDAGDAEALLRNADQAMYCAKESGRNQYLFFQHDMEQRASERQMVERGLHQAIEQRQLRLYYQPQVDLRSGRITGAEALLRWLHPQWGLTLPERFVPIAEASGVMVRLGRWVLQEACRQVVRWEAQGIRLEAISVNVSAAEFRHPAFVAGVCEELAACGLQPGRLHLEFTESVLMHDAQASQRVLGQLKELGVRLSIDDFGTGYSCLSLLLLLPMDSLKIDQRFIAAITASGGSDPIARALIAIATSLKLKVVAEGVETSAQLAFLDAAHCDEGQGHLFSAALSEEHFTTLMQSSRPLHLQP